MSEKYCSLVVDGKSDQVIVMNPDWTAAECEAWCVQNLGGEWKHSRRLVGRGWERGATRFIAPDESWKQVADAKVDDAFGVVADLCKRLNPWRDKPELPEVSP